MPVKKNFQLEELADKYSWIRLAMFGFGVLRRSNTYIRVGVRASKVSLGLLHKALVISARQKDQALPQRC